MVALMVPICSTSRNPPSVPGKPLTCRMSKIAHGKPNLLLVLPRKVGRTAKQCVIVLSK